MSLPTRRATEPFETWVERVVRQLERQDALAAFNATTVREETILAALRELYPVGALYLTDNAALPARLAQIGTWTSSATAATRGTSLSAYIFERTA